MESNVPSSATWSATTGTRPRVLDDRLASLFPDPDTPQRRRAWWARPAGRAAMVVVVVVVLVSTLVATNAFGSSSAGYRTATVGPHNVDAVLTSVATIEPVAQATIAFPVAGTVSTIAVGIGDTVGVGQVLAGLDTLTLTQTLHTRQATLAQDELILATALEGKSVAGLSGGSSSSSGSNSFSGASTASLTSSPTAQLVAFGGGGGGGATGGAATSVAGAQQAVLTAQKNVDADLAASTTASTAATAVCSGVTTATPPTGHGHGGTTTTTAPTTTTTTPPTSTQLGACQTALSAQLAAQQHLTQSQAALVTASNALDSLLNESTTSTTAPSTGRTGTSTGSSTTKSGTGSGSSTSSSPSAADLVKYQAAVDAAAAAVAVAQQSIAQASIVSPIAGTVVAVNVTAGDAVTADSSTNNIVVVGAGGYEVSADVSVANIPDVKLGQAASVIPDSTKKALTGKVVAIAVVGVASTTTTNYAVTVGLTGDTSNLTNGDTGTVSIVTGSSSSALAVPTSAVTTTGGRHTVTILNGTTPTVVSVTAGIVGYTWTSITRGLTAGEHVVLANLSTPLPGSATSSSNGTATNTRVGVFGGAGGFGGFGGGTGAGGRPTN
jgi:multidrug efflux pump subunit AcrA (membrane-fusion protein)